MDMETSNSTTKEIADRIEHAVECLDVMAAMGTDERRMAGNIVIALAELLEIIRLQEERNRQVADALAQALAIRSTRRACRHRAGIAGVY